MQCADKDKSCAPSFEMYNGVWVFDGSNSPKRRRFCRSFAIMGGGGWGKGGSRWCQMVSRFYCDLYESREGKGSRTRACSLCGASRTGPQLNAFPPWTHRPFRQRLPTRGTGGDNVHCGAWHWVLELWRGWQPTGASVCKGNDQISRFKHAAYQNSQSASVNARLLVPQFPVWMLDRLISGIIHRLRIRHTPQRRCVLGIPTLSLHLLSQEESCCLQQVPFSFVPWSVYRQQRWNKEPRCPTGQTGTKPKCGPDAYLILPWLRSALEMKSN